MSFSQRLEDFGSVRGFTVWKLLGYSVGGLVVVLVGWLNHLAAESKAQQRQVEARFKVYQQQLQAPQGKNGDELALNIKYIYDKRTGLCFAYIWENSSVGDPGLTLVPYDKVKDQLLNPPPEAEAAQ